MRSRPDRRHITALEIRASDLLPGKTTDSFQINGLPHFPHISEGICGNFPPGELSGRATREHRAR